MRISIKTLIKGLCAVALLAAVASCGGGGNNDQGVSFTLFGFFKSASGDGDAGQFVPLSTDTESATATHSVRTFYGLQNNLSVMGIRTQRVFMSYYVDGATVQPPSTSQAFGTVLGPAGTSSSGSSSSAVNGGGSLPPGFSNIKSTVKQEVLIVPPDIMAWLNFNRASLPELPFTMTVRTYVTGLTTAGDRIDSNTLDYIVEFIPDNIVPPTGGSGSSSSSSAATSGVSNGSNTEGGI